MRGPVERFMRRFWAGETGALGLAATLVLAPISWAWGAVTALRNWRWDRVGGRRVDGASVISVGNLAAGGTGKTPFTGWLARRLDDRSRPSVVLRGYGGDEGLLHEAWNPTIPVAEGANRVALAIAQAEAGRDVVLLDDGFQHRRLARDLDIVLVSASDPFPQRLMPLGPYRERDSALQRANVVVITRGGESIDACRSIEARVLGAAPHLVTGCVTFRSAGFTGLDGSRVDSPSGSVTVVTGVARPEGVRTAVESLIGSDVSLIGHGDHHRFRTSDVEGLTADAVVVTEKDAVKLRKLDGPMEHVLVFSREMVWEWGEDEVWGSVLSALRVQAS